MIYTQRVSGKDQIGTYIVYQGIIMRILGVRATPKVTSFVVYCTKESDLKCVDVIKIPAILDTPEKLKYVRNNILDILNLYNVELAAIRVTENNADNLSIDRLYIEAIIQEVNRHG